MGTWLCKKLSWGCFTPGQNLSSADVWLTQQFTLRKLILLAWAFNETVDEFTLVLISLRDCGNCSTRAWFVRSFLMENNANLTVQFARRPSLIFEKSQQHLQEEGIDGIDQMIGQCFCLWSSPKWKYLCKHLELSTDLRLFALIMSVCRYQSSAATELPRCDRIDTGSVSNDHLMAAIARKDSGAAARITACSCLLHQHVNCWINMQNTSFASNLILNHKETTLSWYLSNVHSWFECVLCEIQTVCHARCNVTSLCGIIS